MTTQEALQSAQKALEQAIIEKKRGQDLLKSLGPAVIEVLRPVLDEIAKNSKLSKDELLQAISTIKVASPQIDIPKAQVDVSIPPITIPKFNIPKAEITVKNDPINTTGIESAIEKGLARFKIPKPEVTVNIPKSDFKIPDFKMPGRMETELSSVDRKNPLPVRLMDEGGRPFIFSIPGGGKTDFLTIKGFGESAYSVPINSDGEVKVAGTFTAAAVASTYVIPGNREGIPYNSDNPLPITGAISTTPGATYYASDAVASTNLIQVAGNNISQGTELGGGVLRVFHVSDVGISTRINAFDTSLEVKQVSGTVNSVYVVGGNATIGTVNINPDGDPVYESAGLTDTELRAKSLPVEQVSGSVWSTNVSGFTASIFAIPGNAEGVVYNSDNPIPITAGNTLDVRQVSGANWSVNVVGATVSIASIPTNNEGISYNSDNPFPVTSPDTLTINQVSGSAWSTYVRSSGIGLNEVTADILKTYQVSSCVNSVYITGSAVSTVIVGSVVSDVADVGDAPIKQGGIARQDNPTAVSAGDMVSATFDDLGRQVMRPLQVRDLMATAYVSLASGSAFGTETAVLASGSATLLDLVYLMGTNDSDAAVTADFRASTGGTVLTTLRIPANGTAGMALTTPILAPFTDHTWTVDLPDVTGTNVTITALFSKEV